VSSVSRGRRGEDLAVAYLRENGYEIVQRNFRKSRGEVDIIVVRGDWIVFCEVKRWPRALFDDLGRGLDGRKWRRVAAAARAFMFDYPQYAARRQRFDAIFIESESDSLHHYENAFSGE
jgi:putative endonuclease